MSKNKGNCCVPGLGSTFLYFVLVAAAYGVIVYQNNRALSSIPLPAAPERADLEVIRGNKTPPVDLDQAFMSNPKVVARGKELYEGGTCGGCHGAEGKGDGAAGQFLNPKPRSFHSLEGWTNGTRIADIFITLTDGIVTRGMPAVDTIPVEDRFALVHYVRSLASGYPSPGENEKKALDKKYLLSQGQAEPHQVPVKRAIEVMVVEAAEQIKAVKKAVGVIESDYTKNHPSARLFHNSVMDLSAAVSTLKNN